MKINFFILAFVFLFICQSCGIYLPLGSPDSRIQHRETRNRERDAYYSIPPDSRPSWKEYKSYPPKVKVED